MTKRATTVMIGLLALAPQSDPLARGQILHATGDRPSFEAAAIKPWHRTPPPPPTDHLHTILPISILISSAYNLPVGFRIIGGPDWLRQDIDQYEIQAKIGDSGYAAMQKMTRDNSGSRSR